MNYRSSMDAVAHGTEVGLKIYLQIIAMLIVVVALVALANMILAHLPAVWGRAAHAGARARLAVRAGRLALRRAMERSRDGRQLLMGTKTILNELVAYMQFAALPTGALDPRSHADHGLCHVRLRQFRASAS